MSNQDDFGVTMKVGAIILAAGSSHRFGDDKRRARLGNGRMVIEQTIENVLAAFDEVLLTLRADDDRFSEELTTTFPGLRTFCAPDSTLGMGHSLANSISEISDWDVVFICLADMPFIQPGTFRSLQSHLKRSERCHELIIVPHHNGKRGQPTGFGADYFTELERLSGDFGAKHLLDTHRKNTLVVETKDSGILRDIDAPGDL